MSRLPYDVANFIKKIYIRKAQEDKLTKVLSTYLLKMFLNAAGWHLALNKYIAHG